ncbi:hypothetical protein MGU_00784 [Metarhizium guizhouense ARSEF 977]|uniref:Uncharacterized protein n=1 Tax=Metarhizium guizhouense (strain ARSEF 977) TaxID=1276136 RepID=A0A0B4H908_METGA|nr:hypothetical protein MGU_00784 [Metarhizium guizhouense ARSEF 977]
MFSDIDPGKPGEESLYHSNDTNFPAGPFDPLPIKAKGRPKGALRLAKSSVVRSTRRDFSEFEHIIAEEEVKARADLQNHQKPPPSTAPAAIKVTRITSTAISLDAVDLPNSYEPGTKAPRAYMRFAAAIEDVDENDGITASTPQESSPKGSYRPFTKPQ